MRAAGLGRRCGPRTRTESMSNRRVAGSLMADVFISHIHEEQAQAKALQTYLFYRMQATSFLASNVWDLVGGEDWLARIRKELRGCRMMLSLLSSQSITRPWIHFEAGALACASDR